MDFPYVSSGKPRKCPSCGSLKVATVMYGMPIYGPKLEADLEAGRVAIGGCCPEPGCATWQCAACGVNLYREADVVEYRKMMAELEGLEP